jgi:hypothetical protein
MGSEALDRAKDVSSELYQTARDQIREEGFTPEAARRTVSAAADRISSEASGIMSGNEGQPGERQAGIRSGQSSGMNTTNPSNMENGNG